MKKLIGSGLLALFLLPDCAHAQQQVANKVNPAKVTVAVTNTFIQALASGSRNGCTVQYNGTTTGFLIFQNTTPADTTTAFKLTGGQTVNCAVGGGGAILTDQILVTGTAGDVFVVTVQ